MDETPLEILIEKYGFWDDFVSAYKEKRGHYLWKSQIEALENGAFDDRNFLMVSSAGSGKTHVAELILFKSIMDTGQTAVYLAPYNALVEQKTNDFKELFEHENLGLNVSKSVLDENDNFDLLKESSILVMTYEKFDYLLRNYPELISSFGCVVIDEFHMIGESQRGPPIEIIVSLLLIKYPSIKIVGLSAVIPNAGEIASWIDASYCDMGDWRRNPLYEGVFNKVASKVDLYENKKVVCSYEIKRLCDDSECNIIIDFLNKSISDNDIKQQLIFVSSRKKCTTLASKLYGCLEKRGIVRDQIIESQVLDELSDKTSRVESSDTHLVKELKKYLSHGVAFHHAALSTDIRRIIEEGFESRKILILVSTTTLAAGINLPAKRVVVTEPKIATNPMKISQYKNIAGRAGRPKYTSEAGECVILANNPTLAKSYLERYVSGRPETLTSLINLKDRLDIILNLARDYPDLHDIIDVLDKTLFGMGKAAKRNDIGIKIELTIHRLKELGYLDIKGTEISLTVLGKSVSKQIINPLSVYYILIFLRKNKEIIQDESFIRNLLLVVCSVPEFDEWLRIWPKSFFPTREKVKHNLSLKYITDLDVVDNIISTVNIIQGWINEHSYQKILSENNVDTSYWGSSDIGERIAPTFSRIFRVMRLILEDSDAELHDIFDATLEKMQYRTSYGVKENHVDFVKYGIVKQRNNFKNLENKGIKTIDDLVEKDIRNLSTLIGNKDSIKLKRRIARRLLTGANKEKELLLIDAFESGLELTTFERLFSTSNRDFELAVEDSLHYLKSFLNIHPHNDQSTSKPEFDIYLIDSKGNYITDIDGKIKLCLECKSTDNLKNLVKTSTALEVLKKCPQASYTHKVVIGTPDFEEAADAPAKEHEILLIPVFVFARLLLLNSKNRLNSEKLLRVFNETGILSSENLMSFVK
jgi:helicase